MPAPPRRTAPDDTRPPVVILTGASSGIGRATALLLLRHGMRVLLVARRREELEGTVRLAGPRAQELATVLPCDITEHGALERIADEAAALGPVAALVNNAGVGASTSLAGPGGREDARRMLDLNLRAPIELTSLLLEELARTRGVVVNVSSVAGLVGTPGSPVYSATKWGLTGFSEALRGSCAPLGVRVVCVQPGPVPTPGWPHERLRRSAAGRVLTADADQIAACIERAVLGRGGVAPVRPRLYAVIPVVRGVAPWLLRAIVRRGDSSRAGTGIQVP